MRQHLRPYQAEAIERIRQSANKRVILVAPTGSGKTSISAHMIGDCLDAGQSVLFLAHRTELIEQCSQRLTDHGVAHGIIKAGYDEDRSLPVQVASIQTLARRSAPPADVVFLDESHHASAGNTTKLLAKYPQATVIGLTATPWRLDGRPLGDIFQDIVVAASVQELINQDYLVPPRVYAPATPDMTGIATTAGDWNQGQLGNLMNKPDLIGDIVGHWLKLGENRPTIVFAVNIDHSKNVVMGFRERGVPAEHVDGTTPPEERRAILARFRSGETRVVSNCQILTEGFDMPATGCVVLARPTKSLSLYLQMVGRALRPASGKTHALVLDHAGVTHLHGFATEDREWSLEGRPKRPSSPSVKNCPQCFHCLPSAASICPECWHMFKVDTEAQGRKIRHGEGELVELTVAQRKAETRLKKQQEYDSLWKVALDRGYKPGWVAVRYRQMFGVWPAGLTKSEEERIVRENHMGLSFG